MTARVLLAAGVVLLLAISIAVFSSLHENASKEDHTLAAESPHHPLSASPSIAGPARPITQVKAPSVKVAEGSRKPPQSDTGASPLTASRAIRDSAKNDVDKPTESLSEDNALNVKWPPLVSASSSPAKFKPAGWGVISTAYAAANCLLSADSSYVRTGQYSALLRYDGTDPKLQCLFGQASQAGAFSGNRIQFSAFLAGRDVIGGAGLFFRADDTEGNIVAYSSFGSVAFKGSQPWGYDLIIVDVPATAARIYFGAWLAPGGGSLWVDTTEFNIVDSSFPVTHLPPTQQRKSGAAAGITLPTSPRNLDFEEIFPLPN
jgi:hypothetical protein